MFKRFAKLALIPIVASQFFIQMEPVHAAPLYSFSSHTFTSCGASGPNGPTGTQCINAYSNSWSSNSSYFIVGANGIQNWTAPVTGSYQVTAAGAVGAGGLTTKGLGAIIRATVTLTQGVQYKILVGQPGTNGNIALAGTSGGGGGGTFFTDASNNPIVVAGGGGGSHNSTFNYPSIANGQTTTSGSASSDSYGAAGSNGGGGGGSTAGYGSGGGGLTGNGTVSAYCANSQGYSFINGGTGGTSCSTYLAHGGFGGGGGTHGYSGGGAGGGGYSGGGGSGGSSANGGGGGSFIIAGATNIATSNGSYAGSSVGITNLNSYNGTAGSATFASGYLTIQLLLDPVTVQVSSVSGANSGNFRSVIQLQATLSTSGGKVTFYSGSKVIPNCIKIYTSTTVATCNWSPSMRGSIAISARVIPDNGAATSPSPPSYFLIGNRITKR